MRTFNNKKDTKNKKIKITTREKKQTSFLTALVKNAKKVRNEAKEQQPSKRIESQEIYKKNIYICIRKN